MLCCWLCALAYSEIPDPLDPRDPNDSAEYNSLRNGGGAPESAPAPDSPPSNDPSTINTGTLLPGPDRKGRRWDYALRCSCAQAPTKP